MPLEGRKLVKWDPTFNTGTFATIIAIIGSASGLYSGVKTDLVQQKADVDQVRAVAAVQAAQTQESMKDIRESVKELQKGMNEIKQDLAVLRGRAAADTGGKR
jgi:hypothetical protein